MSSLAGYLRELAERGIYDKADIVNHFVKWELEVKYMIMCMKKNYLVVLDCVAPNHYGATIKTLKERTRKTALLRQSSPSSFWHLFLTRKSAWQLACEAGEAH
jgi:hypothetical protein